EGQQFTDLDDQVPPPVRLPADESWVEILNDAKDEFEVYGAAAVFSTWRVEDEDPIDIGDIEIADAIHVRAGRLALNARMTDVRAARLLTTLPEGEFILKLKFLREKNERKLVVENKFDPVRTERKKGPGGHRALKGNKSWGSDRDRQRVLTECLPRNRRCMGSTKPETQTRPTSPH
ncbi:MAG: hypothetical protein AB2556_24065, partial [Candidatus Thiodiazotropha sp.]